MATTVFNKPVDDEINDLASCANNKCHTVVKKPIEFYGKKVVLFGDSIAKGFASNPLEQITNCWANLFAKQSGCNLTNLAYSGRTLAARTGTAHNVIEEVPACTVDADVVIIAGGTNDYGLEVPLGTYSSADTSTVYGALNGICSAIKSSEYLKKATVVFVTPINRTDILTLSDTLKFEAIRNAIYEIATKNGFLVIDGRDLGFPDKRGSYQQDIMYDHVHPTKQGHQLYADAMAGILLSGTFTTYCGAISKSTKMEITFNGQVDFELICTGGSVGRCFFGIGRGTDSSSYVQPLYTGSEVSVTTSNNVLTVAKTGSGATIVFMRTLYSIDTASYSIARVAVT